jgi:hypothetical protein
MRGIADPWPVLPCRFCARRQQRLSDAPPRHLGASAASIGGADAATCRGGVTTALESGAVAAICRGGVTGGVGE